MNETIKAYIILIRPKHWVKNLFTFIPLVFGKLLFSYPENINSLIAFISFCCLASAVYCINDFFDIDEDRQHLIKKNRPLASGALTPLQGGIVAIICMLTGFFIASFLGKYFLNVLFFYLATNLLYSKWLRRHVITDVFFLGIFFLLRFIAGAISCNTQLSHWIIILVFFLAMFLGITKRRQDLQLKQGLNTFKSQLQLFDQIISCLVPSVGIAYMLYTVDAETVQKFGSSMLIYTIPFVYYGLFRYLYLLHIEKKGDDPVTTLLSDRVMQINLLLWIASIISIIYFL